jgi:tight adherence protein B
MTILISVGIFLSVILFIEGGFYAYHAFFNAKNKKVKRRLQNTSRVNVGKPTAEQAELLRKRQASGFAWFDAFMAKIPRLDSIEKTLLQANSTMPLGVFLCISGITAFSGLILASTRNLGVPLMGGCMLVGGILPFFYMRWKRKKRFAEFQKQLPDALDLVARALRAGHAFSVGMKMVGDEFSDPIGPEFSRAVEEISFGIDVPEALKNLSERIECMDLSFFVTSLIVQRETGGNLAEILESISRLIRQRFELLGRVAALSAEGKLSAYILFGLPFAIAGILWQLNKGYMQLLITDPMWTTMITIAGVLMCVGAIIMRNMSLIKV